MKRLKIAVIGGDKRDSEVARLAGLDGHSIYTFSCPVDAEQRRVVRTSSAEEALKGADVVLFPVPHFVGQTVFAPYAQAPVLIDHLPLQLTKTSATFFTGLIGDGLAQWISRRSVIEYGDTPTLKTARAPLVAAAAISCLRERYPDFAGSKRGKVIGVAGTGAIGIEILQQLQMTNALLIAFNRTKVHMGPSLQEAECLPLGAIKQHILGIDFLIATLGNQVLGERHFGDKPVSSVLVDVASPPGSFTPDICNVVQLRGLGERFADKVAHLQWETIRSHLETQFRIQEERI